MIPPDVGGDLMEPRYAILTDRHWMEAYHSLEQGELASRAATRAEHSAGLLLWLKCLTLYRAAFSGTYEWDASASEIETEAAKLHLDLLGLAGTNSKPALDALMSGYYSVSFGMIRNLLETWRRAVYVRLRPAEALPFFELQSESPVGEDGRPRRGRSQGVPLDNIRRAIKEDGTSHEQEVLGLVEAGITHMHAGAHPTAEGMFQLQGDEPGRRVFGPTYDRLLCGWALQWALLAHMFLLDEVRRIGDQGVRWNDDLAAAEASYTGWLASHKAEFDELMQLRTAASGA